MLKNRKVIRLWLEFSQNYKSEAIALAESIRLLNKWVKNIDLSKNIQSQIYLIKDEWMKKHEQYLTRFYVSDISGHSENFKHLYAYEFCIDGENFCFHSYLKLRENAKIYLTKHGSSKEFSNEEIRLLENELPLFINMVQNQLQSIQITKLADSDTRDNI
jgi:hypothetical protein